MAINRDTLAIEAELNTFLATVEDAAVRDLVESWATSWDAVAAEVDAATLELAQAAQSGRVTRTQVLRNRRAQAALQVMGEALEDLGTRAGFTITRDLATVIQTATAAEVDMIATQLTGTRRAELAANLVRADAGQVAAMVQRATEQITSLTRPLGAEAYASVRRELLRGITVGENPRQAARRMLRGVEDRFLGGANRALVIARTELLDAARTAQQHADAANVDVLAGWVWTAHLDPRTCRSCVAQHGTIHPIDEPGPLDHQQGRCARVPRTKTWEELGFEGIKDPADVMQDAEAWFNRLSEDQQRSILTDRGFEAWKAGDYPIGDWSVRRTSEGWRDSYGVSRPPLLSVPEGDEYFPQADERHFRWLESQWTKPDSPALDLYTSSGHGEYRQFLQDTIHEPPPSPYLDPSVAPDALDHYEQMVSNVEEMDGLFDSHGVVLEENLSLYRGVSATEEFDPAREYQVGEYFMDWSYTSLTSSLDTAQWFAQQGPPGSNWTLDVQVPRGGRVLRGVAFESEFILPREVRMRVISKDTYLRRIVLRMEAADVG